MASIDEAANGIELNTTANINGKTYRYKKVYSKPLADIDIEIEAFALVA